MKRKLVIQIREENVLMVALQPVSSLSPPTTGFTTVGFTAAAINSFIVSAEVIKSHFITVVRTAAALGLRLGGQSGRRQQLLPVSSLMTSV